MKLQEMVLNRVKHSEHSDEAYITVELEAIEIALGDIRNSGFVGYTVSELQECIDVLSGIVDELGGTFVNSVDQFTALRIRSEAATLSGELEEMLE